ncbi:hypothetical protein J6590_032755 [Homalodisca vitripennis]|nr:hypothetical protein J6590_032755 [Homalodisca vitripennis]
MLRKPYRPSWLKTLETRYLKNIFRRYKIIELLLIHVKLLKCSAVFHKDPRDSSRSGTNRCTNHISKHTLTWRLGYMRKPGGVPSRRDLGMEDSNMHRREGWGI